MVQHLNTLWKAVNTVSAVTDLTRHSQTYYFGVRPATTFYLQTEAAEVRVFRWSPLKIEVTAQLQASFGWRVATDQDDAGVYVVARRRPVVGNLSSAVFKIYVPEDAYLVLKLDDCRLIQEHLDGTLHLPPLSRETAIVQR
jgi:hypothetical protein